MLSAMDNIYQLMPRQFGPPPGTGLPDINKGPAIFAAVLVMTVVAFVTVAARMYVRVVMIKSVGADDYTMLGAMILSLAGLFIVIPQVHYGAGRHVAYIENPADIILGLKLNFITQPLYVVAITVVKVSIGLFLMRFAPSKGYRWFLWGMQIFMAIYTTVALVTIFTQCRPLTFFWDAASVPNAVCFDVGVRLGLSYSNSAFVIFADFVFAILPVAMLWNVQVNKRVKIALFAILSLGIFASAGSAIKASYIPSYGKTGDFLFDSTELTIWTNVECNVGIIAGSIPSLKPLFKAILQSTYGTGYITSGQRKKSGYIEHSSNKAGNSKNTKSHGQDDDEFEMYNNTTIQGTGRDTSGQNSTGNMRISGDTSQESILPMQGHRGCIVKTTQVEVDIRNVDDNQWRSPKEVV